MDEEQREPLVIVGVERLAWAACLAALAAFLVWDGTFGLCAAPMSLFVVALVGAVISDSLSGRAP